MKKIRRDQNVLCISVLPWSCTSLESLGYHFTYLSSFKFTGRKMDQGVQKLEYKSLRKKYQKKLKSNFDQAIETLEKGVNSCKL